MSLLDVSGLAYSIVNDSGYAELQAKAFREIAVSSGDDQGACKGVRMFLEFLEREGSTFNPTEEKKKAVKKSAQLPDLNFSVSGDPGNDPDLNPAKTQ